jgi:spore maturation protein SpmB
MAANMLGLGNAATPIGLRAMKDLESLNPHPGTATNAMCTFLAINTASVQLIPVTAIAILAAAGANNPTAIVGTSLMATACAAASAVLMSKFLARLPVFREPAVIAAAAGGERSPDAHDTKAEDADSLPIHEAAGLQPMRWWGRVIMVLFGLVFVWFLLRLVFPVEFRGQVGIAPPQSLFVRFIDAISKLSVPFLLSGFPLYAALRQVKVYEEFVEGAKEGFQVSLKIIPYLVAILVAIGMFRAAGGIHWLGQVLGPVLNAIGFPTDLLPLVFLRPLSGSGALGVFAELVKNAGPDSLVSRMGGTIYGSTETTFYVLAVYFGSVGIKRIRFALLAGLTADLVGVVASVAICHAMFG